MTAECEKHLFAMRNYFTYYVKKNRLKCPNKNILSG